MLGLQGGTERVSSIVASMEAAGTEISGVWLQDWTGQRTTSFGELLWWTWQLDRQRYPHWDELVESPRERGIRVLTYVNPWLVDAAAVDFTNPRARDWFADVIAGNVLGVGAEGFMADFGEGLPPDAVLAHSTPALQHNRWPQLWAQTVREGCERAGKPECVVFMRSSYLGSPEQVPLMWAGDQLVDYGEQDGLASAVYGMLSGGVSGMPLWHSDIGGYTSVNAFVRNYVRPPDLNQR